MATPEQIRNSERFLFLQDLPAVEAQAFFWNHTSRRERREAIDKAMEEKRRAVERAGLPEGVDLGKRVRLSRDFVEGTKCDAWIASRVGTVVHIASTPVRPGGPRVVSVIWAGQVSESRAMSSNLEAAPAK